LGGWVVRGDESGEGDGVEWRCGTPQISHTRTLRVYSTAASNVQSEYPNADEISLGLASSRTICSMA